MVKYHKWGNSFSLNLYTHIRCIEKMHSMTTAQKWLGNREEQCSTNYISHKYLSQKCFVSINLSGISINCLQNVFCLSKVEKGTNGRLVTTSTWERQHFSRDGKRLWHYCKTKAKNIYFNCPITFFQSSISPTRTMKRRRGIKNHNGYENILLIFLNVPFVFRRQINILM